MVPPSAVQLQPFQREEATISTIHAALQSGRLSCRALVEQYLRRIEAFDTNGPAIKAIVEVNPKAQAEADAIDARLKAGGPLAPLPCIFAIVKDNFETGTFSACHRRMTSFRFT